MTVFLIMLALFAGLWTSGDRSIKQDPWPESTAKERMDRER